MNWMLALQALLGFLIVVVGFLVKDKLRSLEAAGEQTKAHLEKRIDRENAELRQSMDEIERDFLIRHEAIMRAVSELEKSLPRDYLMRQEFEKRWESMNDTLKDIKKGVDRINERAGHRP